MIRMIWIHSILIMLLGLSVSQNNEWKFEFEKDEIKVYTRHVEGFALKAFKGEMKIDASVDELLPVIFDVENYPKWCYKTSAAKLIKREGNKIFYSYLSETPPLINDREAYFCSEVVADSSKASTIVTMKIVDSKQPVPKGTVRMPYASGSWIFTPLDNAKTLVVFQMHADPGGMIPAWLANLASVESPWVTLDNFRRIVLSNRIN